MKNKSILLFCLLCILFNSCNLSTSSFKEGKFQYESNCASCHGKSGEGLGHWYPPLTDKDYILQNRNKLAYWIRFGITSDPDKSNFGRYNQVEMPPNTVLKEADICNILNYLNETIWKDKEFDIRDIQGSLQQTTK